MKPLTKNSNFLRNLWIFIKTRVLLTSNVNNVSSFVEDDIQVCNGPLREILLIFNFLYAPVMNLIDGLAGEV